ncbi:hypothetical protein PC116_g15515 [Phytophthora cactorum]|nr:hypothetical protein PC116_g15515 [Phytophthora cactorum]
MFRQKDAVIDDDTKRGREHLASTVLVTKFTSICGDSFFSSRQPEAPSGVVNRSLARRGPDGACAVFIALLTTIGVLVPPPWIEQKRLPRF